MFVKIHQHRIMVNSTVPVPEDGCVEELNLYSTLYLWAGQPPYGTKTAGRTGLKVE